MLRAQIRIDRLGIAAFNYDMGRAPADSGVTAGVQTKLAINKPGDIYEQEADRLADQVVTTAVLAR